jgi:hypothetical protein
MCFVSFISFQVIKHPSQTCVRAVGLGLVLFLGSKVATRGREQLICSRKQRHQWVLGAAYGCSARAGMQATWDSVQVLLKSSFFTIGPAETGNLACNTRNTTTDFNYKLVLY